jgi:hypothetical protein
LGLKEEKAAACDAPCKRTAVVFIHGIGGSASTWQNANGTYWPNLLATDQAIGDKIDIYRFDYDSDLLWDKPKIEGLY